MVCNGICWFFDATILDVKIRAAEISHLSPRGSSIEPSNFRKLQMVFYNKTCEIHLDAPRCFMDFSFDCEH